MNKHGNYFFKHDDFEFNAQLALGASYYRLSEVGECVAAIQRIKDGDINSWFDEWVATADRTLKRAAEALGRGHRRSAHDAYLRASFYYGVAFFYVLGTKDRSRSLPTWQSNRDAFDKAAQTASPPWEKIEIPYEDTALNGFFFPVDGTGARRPTVILNNGSDGPVTDMVIGAVGAVERGYNAMTFDGPGQGEALYVQGLPFRHDWEAVITPVVDYLLGRQDVDPERIAIIGVSQAGYWVPRAAAFEHRLAAMVADPGVTNVQSSWADSMPHSLMKHYEKGEKDKFDRMMSIGERFSSASRFTLSKRSEPFKTDSVYDILRLLEHYKLDGLAGKIECPCLITDPEDEQFWPGQSRQLYDEIESPKKLLRFTRDEGAGLHCEPMTPGLRNQRVYDWLDEVLAG
jgi:hypothetical protein